MLKIIPWNIGLTSYILDHEDPEYKVREMGTSLLDILYDENDSISSSTGILLLGCSLLKQVFHTDLYHDLYHLYKAQNGGNGNITMKCYLSSILKSYYRNSADHIPHLNHIYDLEFVKHVMYVIETTRCSFDDIEQVIIRRSIMSEDEYRDCTINALGWIDMDTYWFLMRNQVGIGEARTSLGLVIPYGMRYDDYLELSYMYNNRYLMGRLNNYLTDRPDHIRNNIVEYTMSDVEIVVKYGLLPKHNSKHELIDLLMNMRNGRLYKVIDMTSYIGQETSISMDIITRDDILFKCSNILYTIDELQGCCINGMRMNGRPITRELAHDIKYFMGHHGRIIVVNMLERYIEENDDNIIVQCELITCHKLFEKFLRGIVELGLYARRWNGHGKEYPYRTEDTINMRSRLYIRRMNVLNSKLMTICNDEEFRWIKDNMIMYKSYGSTRIKFIPEYISMVNGDECIREMSDALIRTGILYLDKIYDKDYADNSGNILDVNRIEFMNPVAPEEFLNVNIR